MRGKLLPALVISSPGMGEREPFDWSQQKDTKVQQENSADEIKRHHIITQVTVHDAFDICSMTMKGHVQVRHGSTQSETFEHKHQTNSAFGRTR